MHRKDLFTKHFNVLDLALEDSHGLWLDRWTAADAVTWAKRANADVLNMMIINEWGQAYFRSNTMPSHPQLDGADRLAEVIRAAHGAGLRVSGMWGPSTNSIVCKEYPDWTAIRADGTPHSWGALHLEPWEVACLRSPYGKIVLNTLKDLYGRYEIDMVCLDFMFTDPCFCKFCRDAVARELGFDANRFEDWNDKDRAAYDNWRTGFYSRFLRKCGQLSERMGRVLVSCHDLSGHYYFCEPHTGGHINIRDKGFLIRQEVAEARAHGKTVICTPYAHGYTFGLPKPPAHMRQEFREITVSGDYKLWPVAWDWELVKDSSGLDALGTAMGESRTLSRYTHGSRAVPHVALLNSTETLADSQGHARLHADGMKGMYDVLTRAHIPVELVSATDLKPAVLRGCQTLILSNVARLSDANAEVIRRFVKAGGRCIATYQTSMYDESGRPRYDFALGDVFGCSFRSQTYEPWSYIRFHAEGGLGDGREPDNLLLHGDIATVRDIVEEQKDGMPVPTGHAPVRPNALCIVELKGTAASLAEIWDTAKRYGTYWFKDLTPAQPGNPTGRPAVVRNRFGKGTCYYMAGQIDRIFYRTGHPDYERALLSLIGLGAEPPPLQVVGPNTVEATYFTRGATYVVHLLNHTYGEIYPVQPGTMGPYGHFSRDAFRAVTEVVPISNLRLELNFKGRIRTVFNPLTGDELSVVRKGATRQIRLPALKEYLAVVVQRTA